LATTSISLEQAIQIAMTEQNRELQGIARVNLGGSEPIQPVDVGTPPPPPPQDIQVAGNNNGAWQAQLQQELNACSQKGFFRSSKLFLGCPQQVLRSEQCLGQGAWLPKQVLLSCL